MTGSRFPLYERLGSLLDTLDEVQVKAGIFGRPIKETHGTVAQRVAASHGIEVVANGFRCPPNRANGGTFTDAMGTTCGIVVAVEEAVEALGDMADMASGPLPTQGRSGGKVAAIRERGESVIKAIKDAGGMPFKLDDDFARKNSEDRFLGHLVTNDQKYAEQRRKVVGALRSARQFLTDGSNNGQNTKVLENLHPDVREMILNMSDDELVEVLTEQAIEFHKGLDRRVRINIPSGNIAGLLEGGRYLTTHETQSKHSGPDMRTVIELNMGFPRELDPTLRPASGYVVHPDWTTSALERHAKIKKDRDVNTDAATYVDSHEDISTTQFGLVDIYGDAQLIMNPAVAERTGYGRGDSLNTHLRPVAIDETDPELIFNAVFSFDQKDSGDEFNTVLSWLESRRTGSFANVNAFDGGTPVEKVYGGEGNRTYYEALIPGSVTLDEIEAIRLQYKHLASPSGRTEARYWDGTDAKERTQAIRDEFFTTEMLQRMGFTDEEIQYIFGMLDNFQPSDRRELAVPSALLTKELKDLLAFREANKNKKAIEEKGIKVIATDHRGLNLFDPELYRGGSAGMDVEQILYTRVFETMANALREDRKRKEEYARRSQDPDFESMIG